MRGDQIARRWLILQGMKVIHKGLAVVDLPKREEMAKAIHSVFRAKPSAPDKKSIPALPLPNFSAPEVFQEELPSAFFHSKRNRVLWNYELNQRESAFASLNRDRGDYRGGLYAGNRIP